MPGTMPGADDLSDVENKMRMATLNGDGYISAAEERGRGRERRISGGLLGLTSRSRSRAAQGGAMGHGIMDPSQVQNVWDTAQRRQRKVSTAERPAFYPQAGGANMGQYQQGVAPQQPSPNMRPYQQGVVPQQPSPNMRPYQQGVVPQQPSPNMRQYQQGVVPQQPSPNMQHGHGRRVAFNESAKAWEQNMRINSGRPQRDDDYDDDDDDDSDDNDWGDRHKQPSGPSQMSQHARTSYTQHQKTPYRHTMAIQQQQPQQVHLATQPSPNAAPQQMWPSRSPMIPVQTQLAGGIIPSPMTGARAVQPQPSPNHPQYIQMPPNGISGHPSPMVQSNVMQGGVYPPGHILAGQPINPAPSPYTKTPAHPAQPLRTPLVHAQSFHAQSTNIGDQLATQLSQLQPVPVAGGYAIPEAVTAAIARGQIPLGVAQLPQHQQLYEPPWPPQLVPVPTSGGGGILTSTGGIVPSEYGGRQKQQPQAHEARHVRFRHGRPFSSHMDSHQSYSGSSSKALPNPGADRGGVESYYEDCGFPYPPKRPPQQQQKQHGPQWQQLQGQQQQHQMRQGQYASSFTPQGRFEPLIVIPDLNAPGEFPRLPRVLSEMRVRHEDWSAFIQVYICIHHFLRLKDYRLISQEILGTWEDRNPAPGRYRTAASHVSEIVDKWNVGLFKPLGVDVAFFCGDERKSGDARTQYDTRNDQLPFLDRAAPLGDHDDSSDDGGSDSDDGDGGASVIGLRSQITRSTLSMGTQSSALSMGRQPSALRLGETRRMQQRVLTEELPKISSRQC